MRIYYHDNLLCGSKNGNGKRLPFLKRCLYALSSEADLQPFSMDDINAVLFNKHQSIGRSMNAPFKFVSWQRDYQWYELFKGETVFLPQCIVFSNGPVSYNIVIIGDTYELRVWPESKSSERKKEQWFSHEPMVYAEEVDWLIKSFNILLELIKKDNLLASQYHQK